MIPVLGARRLCALAALGSAATLLAAFGFQHIGGLVPCEMCVWGRWPHVGAVAAGALGFALGARWAMALGAAAALAGVAVSITHVGVEQGWWSGPTACSGGGVGGLATDDLIARIMEAPLVRCDDVAWSFLGLSMAGWNGLILLGLAGAFALAYASSSASQ